MKVVTVRFDDCSQIGFEIERQADQVTLFLPDAPNPSSGTVCVFSPDRVQPLDATALDVMQMFRRLGKGTGTLLTAGPASV